MSFRMDGQATAALLHLELMLIDETAEPKALPLPLLESITDGFSVDQEIGRGGFAVVYKGMLLNGTVAVKRIFNVQMDENEFQREVQCLMKVKHKNIVRFLGYCADTQGNMAKYNGKLVMADVQQRLLCFEYLPNGSVHDYITDASSRLEWRTCYKIIKGICDGLHHLHGNHIVHLDLKPSNVLLDESMVPKIADFGLSRCFEEDQSQTIISKVVGSLGYFAPELYSGKITMKSDIYSVGVIIIEMLTGEKGCPDVGNVLASWSDRLEKSCEDAQLEQIRVCTEIGIDCSDFDPAKRPISTENIIERLKETETTYEESSAVPKTVSRKLFVHPRILYFPSAPNKLSWSSLYLTNYTDEHVAFRISEKQKNGRLPDFFAYLPLYGIMPSRSTHALALTMKEREEQYWFSTLVLESTTFWGASSNPTFQSPLDRGEWHEFFKEARRNGNIAQRVVLEAVATGQREITSELMPPQRKILYEGNQLRGQSCLDVNPNNQWIITGSIEGNVRIWSYETQRKVDSFRVSIDKVVSVKFIIPKKWFVAGSEDGFIHVYNYETKMQRNLSFKAHIKPLKSMAVHPTKPYLLSSSSHVMKLWDWDKGWEHIRTFKSKYPGSLCQLAFNPKNTNYFVTASDNHIVEVWSLDSPQSEYTLCGHSDQVNCFDFFMHDDQQYLITGSNDCTAKIWNMHKKSCTHTLESPTYPVTSVLFYPSLLVLAIGLRNGTVQLWSSTHFRFERIINDANNWGTVWGLACLLRSKGFVMGIGRMLALVDMDNVNDQKESSHYSEQQQLSADMGPGVAVTQMIPEDGVLLAVQLLELRFHFQLNKSTSCSLDLTNVTSERVAFSLGEKSEESSFFRNLPMCGIIPPRSTCTLVVITKKHKKLPGETNFDLILHSTISGDKYITQFEDMDDCDELFEELRETGNAVHDVVLRAVCPQGDITYEPVGLHGTTMDGRTMSTRWKFLDANPPEAWILTGDSDGYIRMRNLDTQERKDSFHVREKNGMHSALPVDKMDTSNAVNITHSYQSGGDDDDDNDDAGGKGGIGGGDDDDDEDDDDSNIVTSLKLIVRKQWFLVGTSDGFIHVCSYETEIQQLTRFRASKRSVTSMAIHPTQPYVLSSAEDGPIKLWNWDKSWECTQTYEDEHSRTIRQVTFNPKDTNSFASASSDHTVKIWSLHSGKSNYTLFGHSGEVNCLDFFTRGDQQYLISGSDDFSVRLCDLHKRACVHTIEDLMSRVISLVSLPDRPYLIIGLQDGTIHLWNYAHFEFERIFNFGYGIIRSICLLGSGRVLIGQDANILIIDTDNVKPAVIKGNNEPEEDMENFSKVRGNVVDVLNPYVVLEAQLEDLQIFNETTEDMLQPPHAVLGTGTTSEVIEEVYDAESLALTCLSLGRLQI